MTKHETIKPEEIENYIKHVFKMTGFGFHAVYSTIELRKRLLSGTNTKKELQAFIDWRDSKEWELEKYKRANQVNL